MGKAVISALIVFLSSVLYPDMNYNISIGGGINFLGPKLLLDTSILFPVDNMPIGFGINLDANYGFFQYTPENGNAYSYNMVSVGVGGKLDISMISKDFIYSIEGNLFGGYIPSIQNSSGSSAVNYFLLYPELGFSIELFQMITLKGCCDYYAWDNIQWGAFATIGFSFLNETGKTKLNETEPVNNIYSVSPVISIILPRLVDGSLPMVWNSPQRIQGMVSSGTGIGEITINGIQAKVVSTIFWAEIPLGVGTNDVTVTLKDTFGRVFNKSFQILRENIDYTAYYPKKPVAVVGDEPVRAAPTNAPANPVVDVDVNIPNGRPGKSASNTIAIVIGNKNYQGDIPQVDFAANDADVFQQYLIKVFGLAKENIIKKQDMTMGNLSALFGSEDDYKGNLYRRLVIGKFDVIIYYSGHGAPSVKNGKGYLVPVDADVMNIDKTGYSIDTLFNNLRKMSADGLINRLWVVFDSCFSGESGGGKLLNNISPVALKLENPVLTQDQSIAMFSSTGNEVSSWYKEKRHGLFTYFLLKGLGGDADVNGNKTITLKELRNYLYLKVPAWAENQTGQDQHPQVMGKDDDTVIVRLK
jgi:hypothetical protein